MYPATILMLTIALCSVAAGIESASSVLSPKLYCAYFQFLCYAIMPLGWLIMLLQYLGYSYLLTRRNLLLISLCPLFCVLCCWTNPLHHLVFAHTGLNVTPSGIVYLRLSYHFVFWIYIAYAYLLALLGEIVCLLAALSSVQLYRQQAVMLLLGGIIPIIVSTFDFTYAIFPAWNITPLSFLCTGGIMLLGIFRFHLWEVAPVAYQAMIQKMLDGVFVVGCTDQILDINPAACTMLGVTPTDVLGRPVDIIFPRLPGLSRQHFGKMGLQMISEVPAELPKAYDVRITRLLHISRKNSGWLVVMRDISEQRTLEQQLHALAYHDTLTGLPNRVLLRDRIEQAIRHGYRTHTSSGIIFLDLDRFKSINDTYGHSMGDEILRQAAQRLKSLVRETDTVARFGGDEFVLVLPDLGDRDAFLLMSNRILEAFAAPFVIDEHHFTLPPSLGMAMAPENGDDVETLLRNADIAMYQAKGAGGGQGVFFSSEYPVASS